MADKRSELYFNEKTYNLQDAISEGKIIPVAFEKCPLCCDNRAFLLCDSCVNRGEFTHTQRRDCGNFLERKQEWALKRRERDDNVRRFELEVDDIERANAKRTEIERVKKKILLIKKAITETKSKCTTEKIQLSRRQKRNRKAQAQQDQQVSLSNLKQKLCNLQEGPSHPLPSFNNLLQAETSKEHDFFNLLNLAQEKACLQSEQVLRPKEGTSIDPKSVPLLKSVLGLCHQYLAFKRSQFIHKLNQHIFPIQEIYAVSDSDNLEMSTATALRDACETAFIGGRWVHTDHRGENHCQIVSSTLPDYSGESCAVNLYVMANRHGSDKPDEIPVGNPSYGIQASIGYTSMFVHLMSVVLGCNLPRKCQYREVREDLAESDFSNFVWRLHENIMHLAYLEQVDPNHLVDSLSLQNVLGILRTPDLGREGTIDPTYDLPVVAELCSLEYEPINDTSMTDVDLSRDWERVPSGIPTFESSTIPLGASAPIDYNPTSAAGALLSNAASSLAGWWRSYYQK